MLSLLRVIDSPFCKIFECTVSVSASGIDSFRTAENVRLAVYPAVSVDRSHSMVLPTMLPPSAIVSIFKPSGISTLSIKF